MREDSKPVEFSEESINNLMVLIKALGELLSECETRQTGAISAEA